MPTMACPLCVSLRSSSSRDRGGERDRNDRDRFDRREGRDDRVGQPPITKRSFSRESQERGGVDGRGPTEPVRRVSSMTDDRSRRDRAGSKEPAGTEGSLGFRPVIIVGRFTKSHVYQCFVATRLCITVSLEVFLPRGVYIDVGWFPFELFGLICIIFHTVKREQAPTPPPAPSKPELTETEMEKKSTVIIEEYLHINDLKVCAGLPLSSACTTSSTLENSKQH